MQSGKPSRTAYRAAAHRAAHQVLERGQVFADPLAARILGRDPEDIAEEEATRPGRLSMRLFIAARTRFAEDALAHAVAAGTEQFVVLGAGLDTFGWRNPHPDLRVFEVDHPATSAWKQARLAEVGLVPPPMLRFAPVDFERTSLAEGLAAAGFEADRVAFFSWLGVVPYLTRDAVFKTLQFVADRPAGTGLVFDYDEPPESLSAERLAAHDFQTRWLDQIGEPWLTHFRPGELARDLRELGFTLLDDLGPDEIAERYFGRPPGQLREAGEHVVHLLR